jgi:hypothetical protein
VANEWRKVCQPIVGNSRSPASQSARARRWASRFLLQPLSGCRVTGYESHLVTGQSEPAVAAVP